MSENNKVNPKNLSRREFLKNAGIVVGTTTVGSAFFLTACGEEKEITKTVTTTAPGSTSTIIQTQTAITEKYICPVCNSEFETLALLKNHFDITHPEAGKIILKASHIEVDPNLCRGCRRCELACSLSHTGTCSVARAGLQIEADDLNLEFAGYSCAQCDSPSCYYACPLKDMALCIDETTGVRYVNQDKCNGCGLCVAACPFDIPRIKVDMSLPVSQRRSTKCDLCKDRPEGPLCIETCTRNAIKLVTRKV